MSANGASDPAHWSPGTRLFFGAMMILAGIFPFLATFDIGPLGTADINGPAWLGAAAGGVFLCAGFAIIFKGTFLEPVFGVSILLLFAAIGTWIGFGAGERVCGVGPGPATAEPWLHVGGLLCRAPFAWGALLIDGVLLYFATSWVAARINHQPTAKLLGHAGKIVVTIALLPILVFLVFALLSGSVREAIGHRLRTGAWPRNRTYSKRDRGAERKKLEEAFAARFRRERKNPVEKSWPGVAKLATSIKALKGVRFIFAIDQWTESKINLVLRDPHEFHPYATAEM